jgi:hypothetical protein
MNIVNSITSLAGLTPKQNGGKKTMKKTMKNKSLCKGARVEKPNKCKKLKGCKVAKGTKRVFCRKTKNKSMKNKSMKNKSMKNKSMKNKK